ncbi:hypothetical protein LZ30DRAFT_813536 [Colletotrichum cereale]|nr:hypothetical protein LZ30DRAFT_813536 [Colletotrichum cereale]
MTPPRCTALAPSQRYIGVYFDTCYASDTLEATSLVDTTGCWIRCPGDDTLLRGGNANTNAIRFGSRNWRPRKFSGRDAPPGILLTFYDVGIGLPGATALGPVPGPGKFITGPDIPIAGPPATGPAYPGVNVEPGATVGGPLAITVGPRASALPTDLGTLTITSIVTTISCMTVAPGNPRSSPYRALYNIIFQGLRMPDANNPEG